MILEFVAPNRPLSENEKRKMSHWAQWRRRLDPWFEATQWAWLVVKPAKRRELQTEALRRGFDVMVELPFPKNARRDPHNYVGTNVKSVIDALTIKVDKATQQVTWNGLWPDDTPEFVTVVEPKLVVGTDLVRVNLTPREDLEWEGELL